ncbi:HAMP domain-containing protein [Natronorubrum sp. JWXQ-INN-674]|uniref:HAMP domain-containing protein n=1 Tax=Natronorubrum halalkaliphilum TaxID=2691917 RepID=A0A6B0VSY7_9EURY|nr:methyl-accepting chemotaxis protein [Natronorubrum halalkaliphilum]MXV64524.1 HAMP domain-containing protein [Natronorubrum halalkaliphilum]
MDVLRRLVPSAIRRRYAVKFGIVLLILGLGVGLVGFIATAGITGEVEERVQTDHTSIASQEAQNLQMWNEQNEHTIGVIAWSEVVDNDDPAAIQQRFLDWEEHLDADTFAISYVDTDENAVLASTDGDLRGESADQIENVPAAAYEEAHSVEGVPWVSSPYTVEREHGSDDVAVMTYVLSVPGEDDRAIVYTAELEAYATGLDDDEHVATMVLDGDNDVMVDNKGYGEDHETLGQPYGGDAEAIVEPARTEGAGTHQVAGSSLSFDTDAYSFDNEDYVVSSARVYGTDWIVVTHEPESQAYGFVNTVNDWGHIATLAGVLMIGLIGAVLGRNTAVSIDRLTHKASKMEEGDLNVDLETKRVDNIGRLYDGFDSMRIALREQIEEVEAARNEAEQERKRVAKINEELEETADEYSDVMEAAADGDLTARMDADSENEAMEEIATEFNQMLEEIERTVAGLNQFATDVAIASEQVTASSEEVRSASQQVTESIQEISDGSEQQNQSLQSVNQEMSGLSTTTEEIAASSNEVADIAARTVETGQDGQEAAQAAITAMDEIETEASDAVDEIRRLEQEVQQIDELIATISEIARQTNMLALNANIEASRSVDGQDDEGFSVVAKEVKTLSENVAEAADEAEDRLQAIRDRTERSADEVEGTSTQIEDAGEQVQEAVEALAEIADLAKETNIGVQEISAATEEQAASTQEVVAMVDDATTISEETTAEAENVAAAAEEQTTALTEVTKSASNLSGQATQLSEALDRFETDDDQSDLEVDFEQSNDDDDDDGDGGPEPTEPAFDAVDVEDAESESIQGVTFETDTGRADETVPTSETDESDSEPPTETVQADTDETDGDAVELGAEEILDIEDRSEVGADADPITDEPATADGESPPASGRATDPLGDTATDPLGDTAATDPLGDDAAVTSADSGDPAEHDSEGTSDASANGADSSASGDKLEDTDGGAAAESEGEAETERESESERTDSADESDETDSERNDDVFTFGNTDE